MKAYTQLKTERHDLREVIPLPKPYTLLVEPSNYCNFRCVSCFQSLKGDSYIKRNQALLPMERFERILSQLMDWEGGKLKVLKLSLYGEPLTNPAFCDMLRLAREADVAERIETTTNASLLTEEIAERLVEYGIDYIRVSVYGASQARYETVTGVKTADIEAIRANLARVQTIKRRLGKERPFVSAKMLDTFGSENESFIRSFGSVADETYIDMPHNWVATEEKSFLDSLYTVPEQREALARQQRENHRERRCCPMPFTTLAIRADGMAAPCCIDWQGNTNLGNVDETPLKELWSSARLRRFWEMQLAGRNHENASCRNCSFYQSNYYMLDDLDGLSSTVLQKG